MPTAAATSLAHPIVVAPPATLGRRIARQVWRFATWAYAASIAAMTLLAGMYVFAGHGFIELHKLGAHVVGAISLVLVASALAGRIERRARLQTFGLLGLLLVQRALVHLLVVSPLIAAFHPVNALLLFWASLTVARGSADAVDRSEGAASLLPVTARPRPILRPEPA